MVSHHPSLRVQLVEMCILSLFFPLVNLAGNFIRFLIILSLFFLLSISALSFSSSTKVSFIGSPFFQLCQVEIYIPNFKPFF